MNKLSITVAVGWMLALMFGITGAFAATSAQPEVRLQAWQVRSVTEGGATRETLQPLQQQIRPGDVIEYEARYVNGTAKALTKVQLTLPVPEGGVSYLPGALSTTPVDSASLDGKHFEPLPLRREVRLPDGRREMQEVPASEYRFLRWNLGTLPAGSERAVRARMQLAPVAGRS
ncbi:hypothetical protein SNE35_19620 [Paucibacter sp. R3-3]|uniref:DUF11 domain-containing protein n=1 Tax=Roseateles agri TaxID=3098619 RepID=A0ABU5DM13_9BURK|nr:hypothetical protein [Paucibacter sp. R3-3]MDY0746730.1 hypothetical protein [Paucibacter sp. R3-3]